MKPSTVILKRIKKPRTCQVSSTTIVFRRYLALSPEPALAGFNTQMLELLCIALVAEVPIIAIAAAEMPIKLLADTGRERSVVSGVDGVAVLATEGANVAAGGEGGGGYEEDRDDFHLVIWCLKFTTEVLFVLRMLRAKLSWFSSENVSGRGT